MAIDWQGRITTLAPVEYQAQFKQVIDDVIAHLKLSLNNRLHSIYVYGSVAKGQAVQYRSDLDLCLILTQKLNETEQRQLNEAHSYLEKMHDIVSKIDFDIGILADVIDECNQFSWGYWLKHHCRCVFGDDLSLRFAPFLPSKDIAIAVNGDFVDVLTQYIDELKNTADANKRRLIQRAAARKLLRSTNILHDNNDTSWPESLNEYAERVMALFPECKEQIHYFLQESYQPQDNTNIFISKLEHFILWLNKYYLQQQ
ncbi:nucleotidyltransferase domain-containing protein [Providencia manganoxydans]|uniref:Nucleotidyltransferase domain-containing protein n=1 Tax=Providencia manganoxydans TaxID=2923283 RepID=A0ABX7AAX0_9GAMM|nr:nucleotidyltransferase domain-containing protein [Providencia manganoxydans]